MNLFTLAFALIQKKKFLKIARQLVNLEENNKFKK